MHSSQDRRDVVVEQESDWIKLFDKLARCRGDGKTLRLKRLSLHNCNLPGEMPTSPTAFLAGPPCSPMPRCAAPESAAEKLGMALAYSCPDIEFLSLRSNPELGYEILTEI